VQLCHAQHEVQEHHVMLCHHSRFDNRAKAGNTKLQSVSTLCMACLVIILTLSEAAMSELHRAVENMVFA
jgi:hypothetical protein